MLGEKEMSRAKLNKGEFNLFTHKIIIQVLYTEMKNIAMFSHEGKRIRGKK